MTKMDKKMDNVKDTLTAVSEFKSWFDGSCIVDRDGRPKVVYHGTAVRDFDEFVVSDWHGSGMFGKGINLTSDPADASKYASTDIGVNHDFGPRAEVMAAAQAKEWAGDLFSKYYKEAKAFLAEGGSRVIPVIISMKKPFVISNEPLIIDQQRFRYAALECDMKPDMIENFYKKFHTAKTGAEQYDVVDKFCKMQFYRQVATLCNYDGLIIEAGLAPKTKNATHYLVFDGAQVRSAIQSAELIDAAYPHEKDNAKLFSEQALRFVDSKFVAKKLGTKA